MSLLLRRPRVARSEGNTSVATNARPLPTTAQILRHGDHGLGVLEGGHGSFIVVRGRCYTLRTDLSAEETDRAVRARSAAITRFLPDRRLTVRRPQTMLQLVPALEQAFADSATLGAFRIDAWFSYVRVQADRLGTDLIGIGAEDESQSHEFSDIMGTIVGFRNVDVEGDGGISRRLHFVDERRQLGGRVVDFEVFRAHVELARVTPVQTRR